MDTFIIRKRKNGKEACETMAFSVNGSVIRDWKNLRRLNRIGADILIRWGSIVPLNSKFEINTVKMVQLMNDKPESRAILQENNVSVPFTYFSKSEILSAPQINWPLIGRQKYHSQGLGMVICNNKQEVIDDDSSVYWSEFIPKDREFRVFVFFGRVLGVCEKVPDNPQEISWNNSTGNSVFETVPWKKFPINACKLALEACKTLNIDFAAVDIIRKETENYVLELNAAPSLSPYRQQLFAKAFKWAKNYITTNNKKPEIAELPVNLPERNKWRSYIHPLMLNIVEEV